MGEPPGRDRLMERLRAAAQGFLSPWGEHRRYADLSAARAKAVDQAAKALQAAVDELSGVGADEVAAKQGSRASRAVQRDLEQVSPALEQAVGITCDELTALIRLEEVKGFGPQKFKILHDSGLTAADVLADPGRLPIAGKTGDNFREAIAQLTDVQAKRARERAARQLVKAHEHDSRILTYDSAEYPTNLLESNNAVPVLYARGAVEILRDPRALACVGSRAIIARYEQAHYEFASAACKQGWSIVSGFAQGADRVGHTAALERGGRTICVMPAGLDRPFPPENKDLWAALLESGRGVMIS